MPACVLLPSDALRRFFWGEACSPDASLHQVCNGEPTGNNNSDIQLQHLSSYTVSVHLLEH